MIRISSSAFEAGERIPKKYSGEGEDVSPPLAWVGEPDDTREFALICDDPDAPMREPFVHWVLYGIPGGRKWLAEGDKIGVAGKNSFGKSGYNGPMPPPGHGEHRYFFKLYALDRPLGLKPGLTKSQLLESMKGTILAEGQLVGTYERKR